MTRRSAAVATLLALVVAGCGARTSVSPGSDGGDPDGAGIDGGPPDTGPPPRDSGPVDTGPPPEDAGPGDCRRDRDCDGGLACVRDEAERPADLEPLPLTCGSLRDGRAPGGFCDTASGCDHGICLVAGTCVEPCVRDADCGGGMRCADVYARVADVLQPLRSCVDRINVAGAVGVRRETITGGLDGGAIDGSRVGLSTAEGNVMWVMQPSAGDEVFATRLSTRGASPTVLFDLEAVDLASSEAPLNGVRPSGLFGAPLTLQIPNGPRAVTSEMGYDVQIVSDRDADLDVTRAWRVGRGRELSLDIYYVGAPGLAPEGERGPPEVADAITRVFSIWSAAGVRLGEVRQHEVVGGLRERFSIIEGEMRGGAAVLPDLAPLFELSAGAGRPTVNVFLVRALDAALGVSGGIPGPHGVHGTGASGIAIGVETLGDPRLPDDIDLGRVLAHELGHHLGLFHTSEFTGLLIEPLPDTPACRLDRDTDGDGLLLAEECEGAGADNLMFWAAGGETLTPQQRNVFRGALVLE